jgi:hypothetical protein
MDWTVYALRTSQKKRAPQRVAAEPNGVFGQLNLGSYVDGGT